MIRRAPEWEERFPTVTLGKAGADSTAPAVERVGDAVQVFGRFAECRPDTDEPTFPSSTRERALRPSSRGGTPSSSARSK